MNAYWKVLGAIDTFSKPILIAKIRTEHDVMLTPDTISKLRTAINILKDFPGLEKDNFKFAYEIESILNLYNSVTDMHLGDNWNLIDSKWKKFDGIITFEALKAFTEVFDNTSAFRIEGTPATGLTCSLTIGTETIKSAVSEAQLQTMRLQFASIRAGAVVTLVAAFIDKALDIINKVLDAIEKYRELQKEIDDEKKAELDKETDDLEKQCQPVAVDDCRSDQVEKIVRGGGMDA